MSNSFSNNLNGKLGSQTFDFFLRNFYNCDKGVYKIARENLCAFSPTWTASAMFYAFI